MLDIFNNDAFSVIHLTAAINNMPEVPGRIGQMGLFQEKGIRTTTVAIEQKNGILKLVDPTPRGGPGETKKRNKSNMRHLEIPHYQRDDNIMADEVKDVRSFGSEDVMDVLELVQDRSEEHLSDFDTLLEYQRVSALKGLLLDSEGDVIYNIYDELDIAQDAAVDFDLDNNSPAKGAIYKKTALITRRIKKKLGARSFSGIHCFCGDAFWDDLITHPQIEETYAAQNAAQQRERAPYQTLDYGKITFENYSGGIGEEEFIASDEAVFFPKGVNNLFWTYFAPADYVETVNKKGLPRYIKQMLMRNGKGVDLEIQSNPLSLCLQPELLQKATRT